MTKATPFDEQAEEYDAWFQKHNDLYQAELEALRCLLPASGYGVEIGVGTGRFAAPLGITIGVEPSPQMAELARRKGIEVLDGIAEALPLNANSFDFAVMVTVVCFLDDVAQSFSEACRILKPNGTLVVGFIDRESELGKIYEQKKERSQFYREATFYSVSELEGLLTKAGFSSFTYRQTLLPGEPICLSDLEGYGSGGFVVVRAVNKKEGGHR